jgi:hypothetical protein
VNNSNPDGNNWHSNNVWQAPDGIHLKISNQNGSWYCADVYTDQKLSFGTYQFQIDAPIDHLDPNVVLGLFSYPDLSQDGTREIDIECSQWGWANPNRGLYTVYWRNKIAYNGSVFVGNNNMAHYPFPIHLNGTWTTHRYTWTPTSVSFQSINGHYNDDRYPIASWSYQPQDPSNRISQEPMRVHLNLWLVNHMRPTNQQELEAVVNSFSFQSR